VDPLTGLVVKGLNAIPGVGWLGHELAQTGEDVASSIVHLPGGVKFIAANAFTTPWKIPEVMGQAMWQDIQHPLRHPGNVLMDALMLESLGGAAVSRVGEVGRISARAGALPEDLTKATEGLTPGSVEARAAAANIGKGPQYSRIVDTSGNIKPVGEQIRDVWLRGPSPEPRLLVKPGTATPDNPAGVVQPGWLYSKDPLIKASQKLIDRQYTKFPSGTPPPIWRVLPPFWKDQFGRIKSAKSSELLYATRAQKADATAFVAEHGKRSDGLYLADKLVAEGRTVEGATATAHRELSRGDLTPKQTAETEKLLEVLPEAQKYLNNVQKVSPHLNPDGSTREFTVSAWKPDAELDALHKGGAIPETPEIIHDFHDKMNNLSRESELTAKLGGVLSEDSRIKRLTGPKSYEETGHLPLTIDQLQFQIKRLKNLVKGKGGASKQALLDRYQQQLAEMLSEESGQNKLFYHDESGVPDIFMNHEERQWFAGNEGANLRYTPHKTQLSKGFSLRLNVGDIRAARQYKGARKAPPSSLTHPFNAEIMRTGGGELNTARLMALHYTEYLRMHQFKQIYENLVRSARPTPEGIDPNHRLLIVTNPYVKNMMNREQALERGLSAPVEVNPDVFAGGGTVSDPAGANALLSGMKYDGVRSAFFPDLRAGFDNFVRHVPEATKDVFDKLMGNQQGKFKEVPGYGWIDDRELGGLNKPNPLMSAFEGNPGVRRVFSTVDAINAGVKTMMTYLRPAYLIPNAIGQVALNLIHTGFLAPYHLARAYNIWRKLPEGTRDTILSHMGESKYTALAFEEGGLGHRIKSTNQALAQFYAKMIDKNSRSAAFVHEAAREGFTTPEDVQALIHDTKFQENLRGISSRANEEVLNYERLGPGEKSIMRRLILFYPFTKASTRYLNLMVKQHPVAFGAASPLGTEAKKEQEEFFPRGLPFWAENMIPMPGGFHPFGLNLPFLSAPGKLTVMNPASISPIQEPADIASMLMNLHGPPAALTDLFSLLAPTDRALVSAFTGGKVASTMHPAGQSVGTTAMNEIVGSIPFLSMLAQLQGQTATGAPIGQSYFPDPRISRALGNYFLLGGAYPRVANPYKFGRAAQRQEQPTGFIG